MKQIVPLISAGTTGPLGLCHLPRLWLKILLYATGRLPEGYRHGTAGIDELLLDAIGVDIDQFVRYVEQKLPTYLECEAWVREHATRADAATISAFNEGLRKRNKPELQLGPQREFIGIEDSELRGTILINDLDDWTCVHAQVTTGAIPPLIATSLHSEFSELLKDLLDETGAALTSIRVDLPKFKMEPLKPMTEVRRKGLPSKLNDDDLNDTSAEAIEYLRREGRPLIQEYVSPIDRSIVWREDLTVMDRFRARMLGPAFFDGALVAWISVHETRPRHWTKDEIDALSRVTGRVTRLIEQVMTR